MDWFFPKECAGCNASGDYFCPNCISRIPQTELVCPFCERPSLGGVTHPVCRRRYGLDGLWSLGAYQSPLKNAIQKLKYRFIPELAGVLVDVTLEYWARYQPLLLDRIKKSGGKDWLVMPVPLHWQRQNWRGFNQSALLAKSLASKTGLSYAEVLKRDRVTRPQAKLDSYLRRLNIKGAFSLNPNFKVQNVNVLLIDDVWTTGSTLKECCYALKKGGTKSVWALTIAR